MELRVLPAELSQPFSNNRRPIQDASTPKKKHQQKSNDEMDNETGNETGDETYASVLFPNMMRAVLDEQARTDPKVQKPFFMDVLKLYEKNTKHHTEPKGKVTKDIIA